MRTAELRLEYQQRILQHSHGRAVVSSAGVCNADVRLGSRDIEVVAT